MKAPAVYIMASQRNGTLYIGVTSELINRVWQHREGLVEGFTKQYGVKMLVWYEQHETMESAIGKEKAMKKWLRAWKLKTIEQTNPGWRDLWPDILGVESAATPSVIPTQAKNQSPTVVVPANAGIQLPAANPLDSRIRGNDDSGEVPGNIRGLL